MGIAMKMRKRPSEKSKKRYIAFRLHSPAPIPYYNVRNAILDSVEKWIGVKGLAGSRSRLVRNLWDPKKQFGIISCSHVFVDDVKLALALVTRIGDENAVFQTLMVSGTIRGAVEKSKPKLA